MPFAGGEFAYALYMSNNGSALISGTVMLLTVEIFAVQEKKSYPVRGIIFDLRNVHVDFGFDLINFSGNQHNISQNSTLYPYTEGFFSHDQILYYCYELPTPLKLNPTVGITLTFIPVAITYGPVNAQGTPFTKEVRISLNLWNGNKIAG